MGRTNPTYRDTLRRIESRWDGYQRALRRSDQPHFDHLLEHAREHADAGGYLNHEEPMFPVLVSIALEHEKTVAELEARIDSLETQLQEQSVDAVQD
jgi:hypothetical protein